MASSSDSRKATLPAAISRKEVTAALLSQWTVGGRPATSSRARFAARDAQGEVIRDAQEAVLRGDACHGFLLGPERFGCLDDRGGLDARTASAPIRGGDDL
jgi:hypothetical protein